jgi:putative phage-type endonuclease
MIQGSEEWHLSRIGNLTASRCHEAVAKTKSGYSASRQKLMDDLVNERLTGERRIIMPSPAMQWGVETEPLARQAYELIKGCDVCETGSVPHPLIEESSASPDGLVGDNGLIEIKCPNTTTMVNTVIRGDIPENYKTQMMWQLACTRRKWGDFVMYDPRLPDERNIWIKRFSPSQEEILALELQVIDFLHEVRERVNMFKQTIDANYKAQL